MSTKYTALLTQVGADRLANAIALGKQLEIARMGVGDGGGVLPTPDATQTKLINEKRRAALNSLSIDPANANQIIAEQVIPENEGGFWLREIGLYDADDNLIAVANCPETYKPQMQEGSGRVQTVRMILAISQAQAVSLNIDPAVVLATRKSVDDKAIEVKAYADELMAKHLADANPHKQYAPLASPALTGVPTAPTAAAGTNTTQLATTAFVKNNAVWVYGSLAGLDLNTLTGSRAGRFWQNLNAAATAALNYPVQFAGSLDVEKNTADSAEGCIQRYTTYGGGALPRMFIRSYNAGKQVWGAWQELASLSSPTFTGTPTAPTAEAGSNTTQLATTAWFAAEIAGIPLPWPQAAVPTGWLKCNGQAFDKNRYPRLAQVYPSGVLPDLRGEFIRGWDDGRGVDSGREVLSQQRGSLINYDGPDSAPTSDSLRLSVSAAQADAVSASEYAGVMLSYTAYNITTVSAAGYVGATRPRNIAFNYIVRAA
ncbi:Tail Collar domain protein [Dickeya chrysanthemi Ech1591]|uniref:Tail Collar domain protein n=1 Tax=Dickeya chrysanthemi (strain Ech1591) TaxID=561229 RepID=C6CP88_DICC1|nr:phage tail protein [Dickeya chrysanthemi]ACT08829.1 Tail Collar domain protein [Dickeya chrysanthemi Ech1591]